MAFNFNDVAAKVTADEEKATSARPAEENVSSEQVVEEKVSAEAQVDTEPECATESNEAKSSDTPAPVPYDKFKETNEEKKYYRENYEKLIDTHNKTVDHINYLERQLEELKQSGKKEETKEETVYSDPYEKKAAELEEKISELQTFKEEIEDIRGADELDSEIDNYLEKYPNADKNWILTEMKAHSEYSTEELCALSDKLETEKFEKKFNARMDAKKQDEKKSGKPVTSKLVSGTVPIAKGKKNYTYQEAEERLMNVL